MIKITVIMGVYNGAKKLTAAVESILNQTFADFEFIICDDASSDNSLQILEVLAARDKRIKIIRNPYNLSLAPTLNNCLQAASGEYIARMDDDDISHSERFEKEMAFLDTHPEYAIVGTGRNIYDEGGIWGTQRGGGERSKVDIYRGRTFLHPSIMVRKEALLAVGGYTIGPETERLEDFDLWCKLYEKGYKGYNLNDVLIDYYEAKASYRNRKYKYRINEYKLKKKWRKRLGLPLKYHFHAYKTLVVGLAPPRLILAYHGWRYRDKL